MGARISQIPDSFFDSDKFTAGVSRTRFCFHRKYTFICYRNVEKADGFYGKLLGWRWNPSRTG